MALQNKIFVTELDIAGIYKELFASYCPAQNCKEYIRQEALSDFLNNEIAILDFHLKAQPDDPVFLCRRDAFQQVKDKLNSL